MKHYIVIASWDGIEDTYDEEYFGIRHTLREDARKELVEAKKNDIEGNVYWIKEMC